MKTYIIINLVGPGKDKVTLFLETNDYFQIKRMVEEAGFGDYKILPNWKLVKGKVIK